MTIELAMASALKASIFFPPNRDAYKFLCELHRPSGERVVARGEIYGNGKNRKLDIDFNNPRVASGIFDVVQVKENDIAQKDVSTTYRDGIAYQYSFDYATPFESYQISLVVSALEVSPKSPHSDPVVFSAIGFCKTKDGGQGLAS